MSWAASGYVKKITFAPNGQKITRSEKLFLLVLADYYNEEERLARPSVKSLSRDSLISERQVQRIIKKLAIKGVITIDERHRTDGAYSSNGYRFPGLEEESEIQLPLAPQVETPPPGDTMSPTPPDKMSPPGDTMSPPGDIIVSPAINRTLKEPFKEPKDKRFLSDSPEIRLSELLLELLKKNNPEFKPPNLQNWAKHIDLMIRIDKRSIDGIDRIIRFAQAHHFWRKNILSTDKLRSQYDRLKIEMDSKPPPQSRPSKFDRARQSIKNFVGKQNDT